jgi:hypothetical protein
MQDEISRANPNLQLLEQHGGLIPVAVRNNVTAPPPPPPLPVAGKGAKEPSPRTNNAVVNRRESRLNLHAILSNVTKLLFYLSSSL